MNGIQTICELGVNGIDGSIQLRMFPNVGEGIVDLVFKDKAEFLALVAGQHKQDGKAMLDTLEL